MVPYLQDFYKKLISSVLDPLATWILGLSWSARFLAMLIVAGAIAVWQRPAIAHEAIAYCGRFVRAFAADADSLPVRASLHSRVEQARVRLAAVSGSDVNAIDTGALTSWSASQTLLAVGQPGRPT